MKNPITWYFETKEKDPVDTLVGDGFERVKLAKSSTYGLDEVPPLSAEPDN